MLVNGYLRSSDWRICTYGKIAEATKNGKKYIIKWYQNPVAPINNGAYDKKTFDKNQTLFDDFVARRKMLNELIRSTMEANPYIICPCEEFVVENHFVEVEEYVGDVVPPNEMTEILAGLQYAEKKKLMKDVTTALFELHKNGIVHCDLNPKNLLLVRDPSGIHTLRLRDFDNSFIVGDQQNKISISAYCSPELGEYIISVLEEDEEKERVKHITEKTDIFSLGLIFHYFLAGGLPETKFLTDRLQKQKEREKAVLLWDALASGCELKLSDLVTLPEDVSLITVMLSVCPEDRPSASEIMERLSNV